MLKTSPIAALVLVPALIATGCGGASAASAVQKECSAKYQAAKAANSLNGQTYRQYYKQCSSEAKAEKETAPATPVATPIPTAAPTPAAPPPATPRVASPTAVAPTTTAAAPAAPAAAKRRAAAPSAPAPSGNAVFPTTVSTEFSKETPGKARLHTCLAQYKVNKTDNGNGGLRWIQAGGGYYSECNNRLKG